MAYKNIGTFLVKVTLKAIAKLDEADVDECMRIAENVAAWYSAGMIDEVQLQILMDALPVDFEMPEEEPESEEA